MKRIGDFLVSIGVMTAEQVEGVLKAQRSGDARVFGEIAYELGYIDADAIKRYAAYVESHPEMAR